ncbi:twin-arginine translocation signal domain-containing protein [Pseudovibrio sp. WM33]|uniref:twin-arginine translocation signal domain-containing protein n=1 Tax=Pseudovibrio sp. WM33 TaxID=1735585 RepID=UPI001AD925D7|nr:twin-arginine translocation signal domain-containing protein [Pseudovibrio sp. WM33]
MNRRKFLGLSGTTALVSAVGLPVLAHAKVNGSPEETLQIQWLGGATMLISFDGVRSSRILPLALGSRRL